MDKIKLWIVEDDKEWLRGLRAYLAMQDDLEVALATDQPERIREALSSGEAPADVVLMDIMLHGVPEGVQLAEEVGAATGARVIMLTSMEEKDLIFGSFQAGAIDYQIKSDYEGLPEAIRSAYVRRSTISAAAAEQMRDEFRRLKELEREFEVQKLKSLITPSELQLLELVDQGYTQSQIAERQFVSIRTVKNHIGNVLKKLGLSGSKEAAGRVREMGLFDHKDSKDNQ
ncbi:response regulator [Paenibacillus sp. 1P07SE]|uniref:response regulator n=1 Tax=Paenibacillus sp. 1P07SE TaxID=3132209 RepID=UPI0039A58074